MFAGVCGGVAEYFKVDPTVIRIAAVLATVLSLGAVPIAYLVAWVIMPEAG
jgi:phage shock protein PspC (stress-responsive transcriptional regulator)